MPLYNKSVRALMHDMIQGLALAPGQPFTKDDAVEWFRAHYPLVKESTVVAHLVKASTNNPSRLYHSPKADGSDDLFFKLDTSRFRLFDSTHDPGPLYQRADVVTSSDTSTRVAADAIEQASEEFAYEQDLRDYLARNLHLIEPGLRLYREDDDVTGIEFPAGGRFIDILAVDAKNRFVVIELKVSRGYDRVVGQLLRYIGWIERHHAEPGQGVRGVIVAKDVTEDLKLACARLADVTLFEYELSVTVRLVTAAQTTQPA